MRRVAGAVLGAALLAAAGAGQAETPQRGGTLVFSVTGQPDTRDCHATPSVAAMHRLSPHYSLLARIDPERYPAVAGDVADSWTVSPDQLAYTFHLRRNVLFHDGRAAPQSPARRRFPAQGAVRGRVRDRDTRS